jgi:hypothetical protein
MWTTLERRPAAHYLSAERCAERYPHLARMLQRVLLGTVAEAASCIRDYRDNLSYGCDAVAHSGLSPSDCVRMAWAWRHVLARVPIHEQEITA